MVNIVSVKDGALYYVTYDDNNVAAVPKVNGNSDYLSVLQWLLDGGTLDPADAAPSNPNIPVWQSGTITTTTTAKQNILTYTVPDAYDFYLFNFAVTRESSGSIWGKPVSIEVWDSTPAMTLSITGIVSNTDTWSQSFGTAQKVAEEGDTVKITVAPNGSLSTNWSCRLIGQLIAS